MAVLQSRGGCAKRAVMPMAPKHHVPARDTQRAAPLRMRQARQSRHAGEREQQDRCASRMHQVLQGMFWALTPSNRFHCQVHVTADTICSLCALCAYEYAGASGSDVAQKAEPHRASASGSSRAMDRELQ